MEDHHNTNHRHGHTNTQHDNHEHQTSKAQKMNIKKESNNSSSKKSIMREGVIDVKAIDKNQDGKIFQDPMDWNVISDEPGRCP